MSYTDDLKETNRLIREVVLPELVNIRGELDELRRHTWPYVQAQKESTQLSDIRTKRLFSQHLDDEELLQLLKIKAFLSKTGTSLVMREFDLIRNNHLSDMLSEIYNSRITKNKTEANAEDEEVWIKKIVRIS